MYLPQGTELHQRYVIENLLGHGGFGITYSAYDKVLNVRVAVKEYLPRQLATRAEGQTKVSVYSGEARQHYDYGLRKFMEEAQSVARFSHHPNIVSARDYFEANGTAYMVMEYVEGVTLKEYVEKKGGRISFEEAKGIMMPVMDALREVHQAGMLHRDISPDNIYISTSAQVKILDFGAARYFAGEQSKSLSVILKPGYAPEEQYRSSGKQGSWTDVYAVGATIYKALTGKTPPDALDRKEEDTLEPPSRLGVNIPENAEQALLHALAVTASQRFQTMGEFQQAFTGGEPMTMAFQTFQPPPESSYTPVSRPGSPPVYSPPPVSAEPSSHPASHASHYPQLPRRSANPAAIAAGIGAGVVGLILVVGLVWYLATRPPAKEAPLSVQPPAEKSKVAMVTPAEPPKVSPEVQARKWLEEGVEHYGKNNFKEALAALEKSKNLNSKDPELFNWLGAAYDQEKQPEQAIEAYRKALALKPDYGEARFNLTAIYWRRGHRDLAAEQYRLLQEKDPARAERLQAELPALASYAMPAPPIPAGGAPAPLVAPPADVAKGQLDQGRQLYNAKKYAEAQKALAEAVRRNPQEAEAHYLLGMTYSSLNKPQPKEALEEFRQAVSFKPDTYSWSGIGSELAKSERHKLAAAAFEEAANANRGDATLRYRSGEAYVKAGDIKKAKDEQQILKDLDQELAKKLLASINSKSGGGRSMGQQIDDLATRIRMQRGEIPPSGAKGPKPSAPPRAQQPPAKPAPAPKPAPAYGTGWKIQREGESRIK
jgi:serine/threonine protein kinase